MLISVVSTVYQAEDIIDALVREVIENVSKVTDDFEIVLIEDGSPDNSWKAIQQNCKKDKRVKGIKLSRNFGQQLAITAGLKFSQGDYVVVIDCDLQDNPLYIPALYERSQEGFDVVYAKKVFRKYNLLRDIVTKMFYGFLGLVSAYKFDPNIGTFSLISRKVVNSFLKFNDYRRGYLMVLKWLGFKQGYVEVEHSTRHSGKSSYSFGKLLEHALKLTVAGSNKLLRFSIYIGIFFSAVAFIGIIFLVCRYFMIGYKEGWTSVMVMITLIGGIIMMLLGIVGLYISAIFDQVRNRPLFLVDKTENCSVES